MLTRQSSHAATISTIFKDYNSLLMLQSWPFNVNITNKTPRFIGFMKSACRFGPSNEKTDFSTSLHHQEYYQYQKSLLKLSGDYDHWMKSVQIRSFFRSYFPALRLVHICSHSVCIRRFTYSIQMREK